MCVTITKKKNLYIVYDAFVILPFKLNMKSSQHEMQILADLD